MTEGSPKNQPGQEAWAKPVGKLHTEEMSPEAINLIEGQELTGPLHGFGQMWQKTYTVPLNGATVSPTEVIKEWKDNFPKFWPKGNRFYGSGSGMSPGEVGIIHLAGPGGVNVPGGRPLMSTGVMVIYADDESFSFMTPKGHPFAGMITFSSFEEEGTTKAQVQALVRAYDPLAELVFRLGGSKGEDTFWKKTLQSLASHLGGTGDVEFREVKVDPRVQWSEAKNIVNNAGIRTFFYYLTSPFRWMRDRIRQDGDAGTREVIE